MERNRYKRMDPQTSQCRTRLDSWKMPLAKDPHPRRLDVLYTVMPRDYTDIKETHRTDRVSSTYGVLGGFLLGNTPPVVASYLYLAFNDILSTMLAIEEWCKYGTKLSRCCSAGIAAACQPSSVRLNDETATCELDPDLSCQKLKRGRSYGRRNVCLIINGGQIPMDLLQTAAKKQVFVSVKL